MTTPSGLRARLPELMLRDERRLSRRLDGLRKIKNADVRQARVEEIAAEVEKAAGRLAARAAAVPKITYPDELPISQRRDEIAEAIAGHQVVIVAGETGSGKTTQLPKICLELGRGVRGMIGHTQPRRIAARTVAERISDELDVKLGDAVGWKVRFTDDVSDRTYVKLMTDGILLAELQSDRMLRQYDTLIIDEAHERSLNIDFILGYLKRLLPRRPDLKVIITSATIDPERFSRHFGGATERSDQFADAPIVEVSGRTYPVEVRYRPIVDPDDPDADAERDQTQAILDAVDELSAEGPGDVLVFLSGEREIRDTADALTALEKPGLEILPLYARLSAGEQRRVFQRHRGRRVVLATNVAETSLTVPGIKYVIDPGFARISRYSNRLKVQRLPIEKISQASANQRKGRCGRTSDGICVRLYTEDDFDARPEFTDPEILRTNLASVILQMAAADLGDIAAFPFVEPPDRRHITDGMNLLHELGALETSTKDTEPRLTPLGRKLSRLPVDPRLARMVLAADRNGCVTEVTVIAAALSIQDPRERPVDKQAQADQLHARFRDPDSDFMSYLKLWEYLTEQKRDLSANRFRRLCRAEYLNYLRVREWQDVAGQLRQMTKSLDVVPNEAPAKPEAIHRSLLAGLLSHIGLKDPVKHDYLGARNARFGIFPGSALFKKEPRWVMAAELVETTRLWGRVVARIEPEWIEPLAEHLVRRTYSEPRWEKRRGAVMASERVTLLGVPIVVDRAVNYGRIDPPVARELFIRHALVQREWESRHKFLARNASLLEEAEELEHKARRRDIVVDEETLFQFYDERVGQEVVSGRHFDTWWKKTRQSQPELLTFTRDLLVDPSIGVSEEDYPDAVRHNDIRLPLSYRFEPGEAEDGVTVQVPLPLLNRVSADGLPWQVPGMRTELVTALIRALPKPIRRNFVPVPDHVAAVLDRLSTVAEPTVDDVSDVLRDLTGVVVPPDAWRPDEVPSYLRTTFQVVEEGSAKPIVQGKDLGALKRELADRVRESLQSGADGITRDGLTSWDFGELPRSVALRRAGQQVTAYPALVDHGATVAIRLFDNPVEQQREMTRGLRRLVLLTVPSPVKQVVRRLDNAAKLALSANPHGSVPGLLEDCLNCAADHLIDGPVWTADAFTSLCDKVRADLHDTLYDVLVRTRGVLTVHASVDTALARLTGKVFAASVEDMRTQRDRLVYKGFVTATGYSRLSDVERYLTAILRRVDKLSERPARDADWTYAVQGVWEAYEEARAQLGDDPRLAEIRWMIEELRISYFAQTLKTAYPVSEKRVYRAIDEALGY